MFKKIIKWIRSRRKIKFRGGEEFIHVEFVKYIPFVVSQNIQLPQFGNFIHPGNIDTIKERMEDDLREAILERIKGEIEITEKDNVLIGKLFLFKPEEKQ